MPSTTYPNWSTFTDLQIANCQLQTSEHQLALRARCPLDKRTTRMIIAYHFLDNKAKWQGAIKPASDPVLRLAIYLASVILTAP